MRVVLFCVFWSASRYTPPTGILFENSFEPLLYFRRCIICEVNYSARTVERRKLSPISAIINEVHYRRPPETELNLYRRQSFAVKKTL